MRVILDRDKSLRDPKLDIAVLRLADVVMVTDCLPLGVITETQRGDDILAVGYPAGILSFISGEIHGFPEEFPQQFFTNAMKAKGQSGGVVYHPTLRRVVGIALGLYHQEIVANGGLAGRFDVLLRQWQALETLNQQAMTRWDTLLQPKPLLSKPIVMTWGGVIAAVVLGVWLLLGRGEQQQTIIAPNSNVTAGNKLIDNTVVNNNPYYSGNNSESGTETLFKSKEQIKKSVVKITSKNNQGTGFIVGLVSDTAYILTVSHVVANDPAPNVEFFGQTREFKARVLGIEGQQENGFALLTVTGSIPSDLIPLYVANKFDLEQGDSVFTFGFPLSGGDWAYDDLSYSSRIAREILFSGSDMKEGNSGSPLIKGDEVVGMVASVMDFAHANSAESIREFLRGAKGGSIVLEHMEKQRKVTIPKLETSDIPATHSEEKAPKKPSNGLIMAIPSPIDNQAKAFLNESSAQLEARNQQLALAEQQRIAAEKAATKAAEDERKQLLAEQQHITSWKNDSKNTQYKVTVTPTAIPECKSGVTEVTDGQKHKLIPTYFCKQSDGTWKEGQIENATTDTHTDNCQKTGGVARLRCLGFGSFVSFAEGSAQVISSAGLLEIENALLDLEKNASILIVGYTDNYEVSTYHTDLSVLRAAAVRQWFEDKGVRKGAIQIRGEVIHLPSSATDVDRRRNHRVDFAGIYE